MERLIGFYIVPRFGVQVMKVVHVRLLIAECCVCVFVCCFSCLNLITLTSHGNEQRDIETDVGHTGRPTYRRTALKQEEAWQIRKFYKFWGSFQEAKSPKIDKKKRINIFLHEIISRLIYCFKCQRTFTKSILKLNILAQNDNIHPISLSDFFLLHRRKCYSNLLLIPDIATPFHSFFRKLFRLNIVSPNFPFRRRMRWWGLASSYGVEMEIIRRVEIGVVCEEMKAVKSEGSGGECRLTMCAELSS